MSDPEENKRLFLHNPELSKDQAKQMVGIQLQAVSNAYARAMLLRMLSGVGTEAGKQSVRKILP